MADEAKSSRWEAVRLWVGSIGMPLVMAGLGFWQFVLKEIIWPAQAPLNVTTELTLRQSGSRAASSGQSEEEELTAIELAISARNPSSRTVWLIKNYWIAYGVKIISQAAAG